MVKVFICNVFFLLFMVSYIYMYLKDVVVCLFLFFWMIYEIIENVKKNLSFIIYKKKIEEVCRSMKKVER